MDYAPNYLAFALNGRNLPDELELDLLLFLQQTLTVDAPVMAKAVRWAEKQKGYDVRELAATFGNYFLASDRSLEEFLYITAMRCKDLIADFELQLTSVFDNVLGGLLGGSQSQMVSTDLMKSMDLFNGLFVRKVLPSEFIYRVMSMAMEPYIDNSQRISVLKRLVARNAIPLLKDDGIDDRFASQIGIFISRMDSGLVNDKITFNDVCRVANALIEVNFLPSDTLQCDKFVKMKNTITSWCNGSRNLKQTLASFAALKLKYFEELYNISHHCFYEVLKNRRNRERLVTLQFHLVNETYKNQKGLIQDANFHLIAEKVKELFGNKTAAAMEMNIVFIWYLCDLYNRSVIHYDLIRTTLGLIMRLPAEIGNSRFVEVFLSVEDKLKAECAPEWYQEIVDHMMKEIIAKNKSNLPKACKKWLAKQSKGDRTNAANKMKPQPAVVEEKKTSADDGSEGIKPADVQKALDEYCRGINSMAQTLKQFDSYKAVSSNDLRLIVNEYLVFALANTRYHRQLISLFKNLKKKTFKQRSQELHEAFHELLQQHIREVLPFTCEVTLGRNMCFTRLLSELFEGNVIDEVLIVESLEILMDDAGGAGDDCFTVLLAKSDANLRQKIGEEKYQKFIDHLETYILPIYKIDHMPSDVQSYLEEKASRQDENLKKNKKQSGSKTQSVPPKLGVSSSAVPENKKRVSKESQRMTFNFQELENPEKLNEVVENLQNILNSENRMKIFIKHMLELPSFDIKEILKHSKMLVALAQASNEDFDFKNCLNSTIHSEYLATNSIKNFTRKATVKLNRIEIISGEFWRNNLMATKKFALQLLSKNMRLLPTESLAHLSMIVAKAVHSEGNSKLKMAVRKFEPLIQESTVSNLSSIKDDLEDLGAELQMLLSLEESLSKPALKSF